MKQIFTLFLYLNIGTLFIFKVHAQQFQLQLETKPPISEITIDSFLTKKSFSNLALLKQEVDSVRHRLHKAGYIDSELQKLSKQNDSLYSASFLFGKKVRKIHLYYSESDFSQEELSKLSLETRKGHFIIAFIDIEKTLQKINNLKTESGDVFSKVRLINIERAEDHLLHAQLEIQGSSIRNIDDIIIKGYEKFPVSFLKYLVGIKKGAVFNQKKITEQNNTINTLRFTETIKAPEALFKENSTVVYLYLKKRNHNLFDGVIGFATDEDTGKLKFNGYLDLELNNNLNFGEQLHIHYKSDGEEQLNFETSASLPYLFRSPIGLGLELKIFKRDSTFITTEQQIKASYQINSSFNTSLGYKSYESNRLLDNLIVDTEVQDYDSKFVTGGITYRKTQNKLLYPNKTVLSIESEIGQRNLSGTKEDQVRLKADLGHIFHLNTKNSVFVRNTTSILTSDRYVVNELFRMGGINSIRGFDENSIDASLYSVLNTEYRYEINPALYVHSIIDLGYFENPLFSIKEELYSFGVGIGMLTKAGIFQFILANGNTEDQDFSFSNTKIHLSLISRF